MNSYYLTLVLKPDQDEKARKEILDGIKKKFTGEAAKVEKMDLWGERELAYPIKHETKGFYAHFQVVCDPQKTSGLDKMLKMEEDILRYLLVRI